MLKWSSKDQKKTPRSGAYIDILTLTFQEFALWEKRLPGKVWFKFITTRPGVGCVLISGTNKMLMWLAE